MEIQYAQDGCTIDLGHRGETGVTQVIFDVSPWVKEFGAGAAVVLARRSVDRTPYPVAIEQDGGMVTWTVGAADTAYTGSGKVELYYYVQEQLVKTAVYKTSVSPDIGAQDADVPDQYQGWVDKITRVGAQAGIDAQSAAASAQAAADSAEGAAGSAANAGESAGAAEQSAQRAETAAQTATEQAGKAQTSEESAQRSATEASQSATTATDKAAEAAQSAQAAQQAQAAAETAQGKAEDAQAAAEEAARQAAQSAETAGETALGAYVCKTAEGTVVSFDDGAENVPVKSCVVQIEPIQEGEGDPSPDNVRPIRGWTSCSLTVSPESESEDKTVYSIPFPAEAGTVYGGKLDVTKGELVIDRAMVDLGSLSWNYYRNYNCFYSTGICGVINHAPFISSIYSNAVSDGVSNLVNGEALLNISAFYVKDNRFTDATTFKTAVTGQQLVYELATPITYTLTPTEIKSLLGDNNIWADCGPLSVTYRADPTILYNKLANAILSTGGNV